MSIDRDIQEKVSLFISARALSKKGTFTRYILCFLFLKKRVM